ncbi:MAG: hypothetical protein AB7J35_01595 [Dehalococcoidia bacterium]
MKLRNYMMFAGILPMILGATLFGACGGDDDDGGSGGGTGSDEKFVADICKAGAKFSEAMDKLQKDLSSETDFTKIAEKAAQPFEDFANDFSKANPPSDLKEWHDSTSDALKTAVKGLKDGDFSALDENLISEPPGDAANRLAKVAEDNKDCQEADLNFDS